MIQFKPEICRDLDAALRREWLETNGLGGFASSTIIGLNTRRYHGLLVAAAKPPVGRFVLLSKLEETLFIEGQAFELSANRYPGVVHPQGFRYLKQFRLDPFPVFTYEVEGIEIEKSVFMIQGENSTVVHYELKKNNHPESPKNLWLELRPLIAFRDYHSTTHENGAIVETSRNVPTWRVSALTRDYPPCTWPTMRLTCERPVIGIAISSTTPSANAGSIFLKTSSILWSSASICASDAKLRLLLPQNNVTSRRWLSIDNRRSRAAGTPRYPLPLRTILFRPWPPQPTNTSSPAETIKPLSQATTGSATGAATP